jgi:hypothetical protein
VRIDGVEVASTIYTNIEVTFERPEAARRGAVGAYGATSARLGKFRAGGSLDAYYTAPDGRTALAKVKSGAPFSFSMTWADPVTQRAHAVVLPHAQYQSGPIRNDGGSRMIQLPFRASIDLTLGYVAKWARFEHYEV